MAASKTAMMPDQVSIKQQPASKDKTVTFTIGGGNFATTVTTSTNTEISVRGSRLVNLMRETTHEAKAKDTTIAADADIKTVCLHVFCGQGLMAPDESLTAKPSTDSSTPVEPTGAAKAPTCSCTVEAKANTSIGPTVEGACSHSLSTPRKQYLEGFADGLRASRHSKTPQMATKKMETAGTARPGIMLQKQNMEDMLRDIEREKIANPSLGKELAQCMQRLVELMKAMQRNILMVNDEEMELKIADETRGLAKDLEERADRLRAYRLRARKKVVMHHEHSDVAVEEDDEFIEVDSKDLAMLGRRHA